MATHRAHAIQISTNQSLAPRRLVSFGGLTRSVPDGGEQPRIEAGLGIEVGEDRFPLAYSHAVLGPDHPTVIAGPQSTSFATSHLAPPSGGGSRDDGAGQPVPTDREPSPATVAGAFEANRPRPVRRTC